MQVHVVGVFVLMKEFLGTLGCVSADGDDEEAGMVDGFAVLCRSEVVGEAEAITTNLAGEVETQAFGFIVVFKDNEVVDFAGGGIKAVDGGGLQNLFPDALLFEAVEEW